MICTVGKKMGMIKNNNHVHADHHHDGHDHNDHAHKNHHPENCTCDACKM